MATLHSLLVGTLLVCLLLTVSSTLSEKTPSRSQLIVDTVNNYEHSSWTARMPTSTKPRAFVPLKGVPAPLHKAMLHSMELGVEAPDVVPLDYTWLSRGSSSALTDSSLPAMWDARTAWPKCVPPILNQGDCSSCWSFASTESLSHRFCIASNATIDVQLSAQYILSCEFLHLGCTMGSMPDWAWNFLKDKGTVSDDCVPYVSGDGHQPKCPSNCTTKDDFRMYRASNFSHVGDFWDPTSSDHITAIMEELVDNGPVDATFWVYSDFDLYSKGVYRHTTGSLEGLHSVKIVGYGTETNSTTGDSTDYWTVQNSWGEDWRSGRASCRERV
eukprot:TRINITY_DN6121_c0_g2_i2.p1 TRINITY_DN6121_c0_g2~~TRINITY_DN6121_c0_g2_i2.p1  ORF type:complete len:329 (+),score=23.12 TRINITY_DN6121_c0_g2_i2:183-1169(+)